MPASFDFKKGRDCLSAVSGLLWGSASGYASVVRLCMSALQSLASVGGKGDVTAAEGSSDGDGNIKNRECLYIEQKLLHQHHARLAGKGALENLDGIKLIPA
eukprot:15339627-Ditylum_brightwellii.AAC.2